MTDTPVTPAETPAAPATKHQQRIRQRERLRADLAAVRSKLGKQSGLLRRARCDLELLLDATAAYVTDDPAAHASGDWVASNERLMGARQQAHATLDVLAAKRGEA